MIRIHFPFADANKPALNLAAACGVGRLPEHSGVASERFRDFLRDAPRLFRSVPLKEADLVFYPHCYAASAETLQTAAMARRRGLPCIFVKHGDDATPLDIPYGTMYKESILRSHQLPHEQLMPAFIDDPVRAAGLQLREYDETPTVGFCGFTSSSLMLLLYKWIGRREKRAGLIMRRAAIAALRRSPAIGAEIIHRRQYWGGVVRLMDRRAKLLLRRTLGREPSVEAKRNEKRETKVYREFLDNMLGSDYTLCVRGAGNYSMRFYETLAAARIPIFVDSDCVLPFSDEIDWKSHCVWVDAGDLESIPEKVLAFHRALSPSAFRRLQLANRRIYEEYFTPTKFYSRMLSEVTRPALELV